MSWKLWQKPSASAVSGSILAAGGERANHKPGKKTYFFLNIWQVMSSPHEQLTLAPRVCFQYFKECFEWFGESKRTSIGPQEWELDQLWAHETRMISLTPIQKSESNRTPCTNCHDPKLNMKTDLFWNQILICRSVRQSWCAISIRLRRVR